MIFVAPVLRGMMTFNYRLFFCALLVIAAVVYGVFLAPPLTSGGSAVLPGVSAQKLEQSIRAERAFCEENAASTDCACFADKSGIVQAAEGARIRGAVYADQQQLARDQAASSC